MPTASRRSGREFAAIINSSAVTAILDVGFARRDDAGAIQPAISTLANRLLTSCFNDKNFEEPRKNP
ncbi:hypothetical protein MPLSOD_90028 [Mesorhizobium sp. SOD10]|nr:hypothetical protein MPLSOD_90028 [Mesorhizobium sp. SOD10]